MLFKCSDNLLQIGKYGRDKIDYIDYFNYLVPIKPCIAGYLDLIEAYKYYQENGFSKDAISKHVINLDFDTDLDLFKYF